MPTLQLDPFRALIRFRIETSESETAKQGTKLDRNTSPQVSYQVFEDPRPSDAFNSPRSLHVTRAHPKSSENFGTRTTNTEFNVILLEALDQRAVGWVEHDVF